MSSDAEAAERDHSDEVVDGAERNEPLASAFRAIGVSTIVGGIVLTVILYWASSKASALVRG
jgi:hypothetical protein